MATERASRRSASLPPPDRGALEAVLYTALPAASVETRASLVRTANLRSMRRDDILQRQGEADDLAMILDGYVALLRLTVDGREIVARVIGKGHTTGVVTAALGGSVDVQSVALSNGAYATWTQRDIRSALGADGGLARDFLGHVLHAVAELSARLETLHYQDAERRVARALYEYRDLVFSDPPIILPNRLPAIVGTSREMVSRAVRRLGGRGAIERSRGGLRLLDLARLQEVAGVTTEWRGHSASGTSSSSRARR